MNTVAQRCTTVQHTAKEQRREASNKGIGEGETAKKSTGVAPEHPWIQELPNWVGEDIPGSSEPEG